MKSRDHLFRIIKSMTIAEKRFFNRFVNRHKKGKENKNLKLYQAINALSSFDETELRQNLKGEALLNQLPVAKIYLRNMLLESLCLHHRGKTKSGKLRQGLDQIEVLYQKGMIELAMLVLKKNKALAVQFDHHTAALDFLRWEQKLLKQQASDKGFNKVIELQEEERTIIRYLHTESELRMLHDQIFTLLNRFLNRAIEGVKEEVSEIMENPVVKCDPSGYPFNAHLIFLYIHLYANQIKGDYTQVTEGYSQMVALWDLHPKRIDADGERYLLTRIGLLESYQHAHQNKAFREELLAIREMELPAGKLAATRFYFTFHLELLYVMNTGHAPLTEELDKTIQTGLETHSSFLGVGVKLAMMYNLCSYFFTQMDFSRSLRLVNTILNEPEEDVRGDIRMFSRCLRLILHYELGNHDLLEYLLPAAKRILDRHKAANALGLWLVKELKRLLTVPLGSQHGFWKSSIEKLANLKSNHSAQLLGMAEIELWIRSKVNRRSMLDLIAESQPNSYYESGKK